MQTKHVPTGKIEAKIEELFSVGPCRGVIRRTPEARMENCKAVCDEKTSAVQSAQKLNNLCC